MHRLIYGPKSSGATTLLSADGSTILTDKEAIFERLSVLNRSSPITEDVIGMLPQTRVQYSDEFKPSCKQELSSGKARDAITARSIRLEATHGRDIDRVVSQYVGGVGYPTRILRYAFAAVWQELY